MEGNAPHHRNRCCLFDLLGGLFIQRETCTFRFRIGRFWGAIIRGVFSSQRKPPATAAIMGIEIISGLAGVDDVSFSHSRAPSPHTV